MLEKSTSFASMNRRQVLSGGAALGAALYLPNGVGAQTPKAGGRFRMGLSEANSTDVLTPGSIVGSMTHLINGSIRNCLIELSPTRRTCP